jgi:lipopolysaccharide/colanic/teichoic acid biosynthesis glycosyltransferase
VVIANDLWDHLKRAIELVLSVALIILSLPISILLAMVVWVQDPGPLLFAKIVVTRGGGSFRQLKLRSMIKNAEHATGAIPAALVDARVTWLGHALRRTHIDELPQMINIARGEMSLVGPRPERVRFVRQHLEKWPRYRCRHAVRPGLAGMAQVYGDYYSTPREKLRYDLLYIRRRSFGLDLKLFVSAMLLGLIGVWPGMHRGRRAFNARRQEQRWRAAYEALHGGEPEAQSAKRKAQSAKRENAKHTAQSSTAQSVERGA